MECECGRGREFEPFTHVVCLPFYWTRLEAHAQTSRLSTSRGVYVGNSFARHSSLAALIPRGKRSLAVRHARRAVESLEFPTVV